MRGFQMNREVLAAGALLPSSAALATSEPVTLLEAALWTITINGQVTAISISDLLAIVGGIVGVCALVLAIAKHFGQRKKD